MFVNLLNPKVAIFVLAFIPQFIDLAKGSAFVQFLVFGAILTINGTIIILLVGAFSGSLGTFLVANRKAAAGLRWFTGAVFLGLAARLAFERC